MKKIISTLLLLGFAHISFAAQPTSKAAAHILRHYGKKGFSGLMTSLHWGIAAGGSINEGQKKIRYIWNEEKNLATEKYTDAQDNVNEFITSALKKTHGIKINGVKVEPSNPHIEAPFPGMACLRKHILINSSTASEITNALESNNQEVLDKWRGALEHEATHIEKEDLLWRIAADLTLPFITHGSIKIIRKAIPFAKKNRSFLGEQFLKIPTAFGKGLTTDISRMTFYKHQERRADNAITNDEEILNGIKTYFSDLDECRINNLKNLFSTLDNDTINKIDSLRNILETHPLPKKRIAILEKRIASLEETKKNESDNSEDIS